MTVLRIGAPNGEVVIAGSAIENRQLFELIARFGWFVEERHKRDFTGAGWVGEPIRKNHPGEI